MSNILSINGVKHNLIVQFKTELLFLRDSAGPQPWDANRLRKKKKINLHILWLLWAGHFLGFFFFKVFISIAIENGKLIEI